MSELFEIVLKSIMIEHLERSECWGISCLPFRRAFRGDRTIGMSLIKGPLMLPL